MSQLKKTIGSLAVVGVVSWVGYSFWAAYQPRPELLQGQIEAEQYNISSKVPGRIENLYVKKGDMIEKGQAIFSLYSPEIDAKLAQAKAGEAAASALAEEAEQGARTQQVAAAKDQWQKAKAANKLLEKTYTRVNNLYNDGVVSEQKKDETYTQWQAAKYTESAAYQMYQMAKEGARTETKRAANEKVKMAMGSVAEVEAYVADTKISSWYTGEVTQVLLNEGEIAPQGFPVVSVIDIKQAWAVFHVREDKLKNYKKDQQIDVYLPALDQTVPFKITHIAVMGDYATWRATDNSQGFDLKTFEIEAHPVSDIPNLRVGMSAIVKLD
ncbi:efflux RND transporter periplasmic adaptor subunit [Aliivibrio sp. S4TY2]|uniref:HlyD family secretion protein n=1 Tax=unclassified Aliivibrio TaxID=2645654 RepID=UPI002378AFC5|nr:MULTISPECIES: efflux RND transporter periplasmic adaptor subunit [unclassified Aliivibrio]MDD9157844.1 efflux RND transporter periplasmic adaptor subunit [Aliivibrio sp. S4TY2]MDD9161804.1 efflux RND transporter periplasmic adaptor subunit [Aliivibrio sp. S4TY1]MDD9165834.1 efflux RND transporter periplasmic adaptor subunit [Aliivibrio sp. S4MY2]MDD9169843.1 efflux RND transporter periplasmic adaptor subunit [Aliivibrio sp. S4MY4]MDD9186836.1 efflux RND transporter periplasmic adaptor subun